MYRVLALVLIVGAFHLMLSVAVRLPAASAMSAADSSGAVPQAAFAPGMTLPDGRKIYRNPHNGTCCVTTLKPIHLPVKSSLPPPSTPEERRLREEALRLKQESWANRAKTREEADRRRAESLAKIRAAHPGKI